MSLKVWLPLTGTLENKGLLQFSAINNVGAVVNSSGKIGSCYSFNGSNQRIEFTHDKTIWNDKEISIAMWYKYSEGNTTCTMVDIAADLCLSYTYSSPNVRFNYWRAYSNNGTRTGDSGSGNYYDASVWHHVVLTCDHNINKIYVDGVLDASFDRSSKYTTNWKPLLAASYNKITLAKSAGSNPYGSGYLNDIRIYDHCLSAAEVKEISQGLVLHYKLDSFQSGYGNKNLLARYVVPGQAAPTSTANGGRTTWLGDYKITIPATENADTYFRLFMTEQLTSGTVYTISCKVSGLLNGSYYRFPLFAQNNSSMGVLNLDHNGLCSLTFTMNWTGTQTAATGANGETVYVNFLDDSARALASGQGAITLYDFKLEKGSSATEWCPSDATFTQIQDSSGYGHNGTLNNIVLVTDSARFNNASQFNGTDSYIKVTDNDIMIQGMEALTINLWAKSSSWPTNGGRLFSCTESGGFNSEGGNSGYWRFPIHVYTNAEQTSTAYKYDSKEIKISDLPVNNWVMITWVYDTTGTRTYINGTLHHTYVNTSYGIHFNKNARLFLGCEANTANPYTPYYNGQMSDFRLYTTALSTDDIKQLYQVSAKVDNLGRLHTFEAIETKKNLMFPQELNRTLLTFGNGLTRYTQANCQVTLDEEGYHIYRPPNALNSSNGGSNNMWGGLKLTNASTDSVHVYNASIDNIWGLQTGHTYLWAFHAKGQSTNSASLGFNHNMGNGVSNGCAPAPTILANSGIPTNFQGEKDCFCIFTIGDAIIKTSTSTSAGFTSGSQYLSYRHFTMGYGYSNTGELGTDLHLTDFRLYDITNYIGQIKKTGITNFSDYVERNGILQIRNKAELLVNNLIER